MNTIKRYLHRVFIDGLSGMALGLFATLIVGTILGQIGTLLAGTGVGWCVQLGGYINIVAGIAKALTGAGIGVGVAVKFKESPLVALSAATAGMIGAFAATILQGGVIAGSVATFAGPGEPLGAFVAAYVAIEVGHLVSGRTKVDILVTPVVTIAVGSVVGLLLSPPISAFMNMIGSWINWGTEQQPVLMGVVVSVLMGMALTLPISSAAIGISLGLSGVAAGAAVAGCSAQMIGFAVMSYRENRFGGLIAQGLGTSMLQIPNIFRKPTLWIPPIVASAITGPISSALLGMVSNASGSGMGTAGLVGQIMTYQTMTAAGVTPLVTLIEILCIHVLLPAVICFGLSEAMRKLGWIKKGDLALQM